MTLAEFKAWLDGFTDAMDGPPSAEQWDKIKQRISALKEAPAVTVRDEPWITKRWGTTIAQPLDLRGVTPSNAEGGDSPCRVSLS